MEPGIQWSQLADRTEAFERISMATTIMLHAMPMCVGSERTF